MGEDAEGAAENVSKLRQQMLALTGVDIQLDDTTYKSTYQILLEISKVWGKLDDLSRSSVLEQLFGKRQANIGAAILENGDLLEKVYKSAESSAGSAMREQEEYAKSIQYSLDTLKAAYQDFSQTVIESDFVKNLLSTAQSFLEVLTKIIDKFGVLPTILTGIAAIGGIKGIGIFGNLNNGLATLSQNFDKIKQVANYDFGSLYKKYNIDIKGLGAKDIDSLQQYVNLLNQGKTHSVAFASSMSEASEAARAQTYGFKDLKIAYEQGSISANQYATATQNLALTQRTATATSKALSIALNTLANIGIMVAINLAIKGISALVDKLVVTKEELAEIRQKSVENIKELSDSIDELVEKETQIDSLVEEYRKIISSTDDIAKSKDELLTVQNDIIEQFGAEKNSLDLLNDSYDTTITKIKELSDEEFKRWKRNNAEKISELEDIQSLNVRFTGNAVLNDEITSLDLDASNPNRYSSRLNELYESYYVIKDIDKEITDVAKNIDGIGVSYSGWFKDSLSLSGDIREAYSQLGELLDAVDEAGLSVSVEELSERYETLGKVIADIDNISQKKSEHEISNLSAINDVITPNLDKLNALVSAMGDARTEWFKALDEMENGFGKTVDSMSSSLQKLVDGKNLSSSEFWDLMELDTNKIITDIKMVGDEFVIDQQQLIQLKDQQIQKQIDSLQLENSTLETKRQTLATTIKQARAELSLLGARGMSVDKYRREYQEAENSVLQAEKNLQDYGDQIRRNNILIDQWRSKLGDTADYTAKITQEIKELNDYADNLLKAQEHRIDQIIDGHQRELDSLNAEKEVLQDELDALNDQKDAIEDIIKNYESVNSLVQDTVQKEIDSLNEQKKAIEDTYNKRIEALKTENEEREDALEYAQKLANLENAKNNKVRVIDATRGFRYESVKEDVAKAQSDLDSFENAQAIKALEKARDAETKVIDDVIEEKEKYSKSWADILDAIKTDEDELLAAEILGADWREKIAQGDTELMEKFRTEYLKHNTNLKTLTNTEIKLKEAAIQAKDAEIKSKSEQIKKWKEYKTEVQNAAEAIKNANDGYLSQLSTIELDETSSLERRQTNLDTFKTAYADALQTAIDKQRELDGLSKDFGFSVHVDGLDQLQQAVDKVRELGIEYNGTAIVKYLYEHAQDVSKEDAHDLLYAYADLSTNNQGLRRYGAPKSLYNTLMANPVTVDVTPKRYGAPPITAPTTATTINNTVNVDKIVTDNPQDFTKQLDRYYQTKLTESYTNK